jgi:hypothetical protein
VPPAFASEAEEMVQQELFYVIAGVMVSIIFCSPLTAMHAGITAELAKRLVATFTE